MAGNTNNLVKNDIVAYNIIGGVSFLLGVMGLFWANATGSAWLLVEYVAVFLVTVYAWLDVLRFTFAEWGR